jgi:hypothetical protein
MKPHLLTVVVLLLALACYVADLPALGLVLFFVGAAFEMALWLHAVQAPRRATARLLARVGSRR